MKRIFFKKLDSFEAKILMDWLDSLNKDYNANIKYENIILDEITNDFSIELTDWLEIELSVYYGYVKIKCTLDSSDDTIHADNFHEVIFQ